MAKRKPSNIKPEDLTPREGKSLRFFVGRKRNGDNQTAPDACMIEGNTWTDLPHNHSQAMLTVSSLVAKGLLIETGEDGVTPTLDGIELIAAATKAKMWQAAPPPSVTNNPEHIEATLQEYRSTSMATKPAAKPKAKAKKPAAKKPAPKPKAKPAVAKGLIRIKKKAR